MASAVIPARIDLHRHWPLPQRVDQAEVDLDVHDARFVTQDERYDKLDAKIDRLSALAFTLVISLLTTSLLLFVNLVR